MTHFIALDSMTHKAWIELPQQGVSPKRKRGSSRLVVMMPGYSERVGERAAEANLHCHGFGLR
jgi:hypothetical protein